MVTYYDFIAVPPGGEWLPADIGGCIGYYRSDLGAYQDAEKTIPCTADTLIWTGANQVVGGAANDAVQATESKRFVYKENILDGYPSWRSDAVDDSMEVLGNLVSLLNGDDKPFTLFYVLKRVNASTGNHNLIISWRDAGYGAYRTLRLLNRDVGLYTLQLNCNPPSIYFEPSDNLGFNPHYGILTCSGLLSNMWLDGSQIATNEDADLNTLNLTVFTLGGDFGLFAPIDYFDIAIYDNEISSASRTLLNNYSAARYPSI